MTLEDLIHELTKMSEHLPDDTPIEVRDEAGDFDYVDCVNLHTPRGIGEAVVRITT